MSEVDAQPAPSRGFGWIRALAPVLGPYRRHLIAALGLAVAAQVFAALAPLVQKVILDDAIVTQRRSLSLWVAILVAVGAAGFVANYARRRLGGRTAVRVQRDLQIAVHRHMQHLDAARRDELRTGDVMSRATADLTLIQVFLQQLAMTAGSIALLASSLVIMALLSPQLAVVIGLCVPVFWWVSVRFRQRSFPASWMDQRYQAQVAGVVEEAVTGVRIVKAFGQEQRELDLLIGEASTLYQSRVRSARITARYTAGLQAIPTLGQFGVLAFGGWLGLHGHISLGVFLAFASYVVQLIVPVRLLSAVMATSQQARAGAHRVMELLSTESLVTDAADAFGLEDPRGEIELDRVTFGYRDGGDAAVLRDVSLTIRPGERVAVVGGSGSGKSTLAMLLARFYDADAGVVRVDGHDVRRLRLDSLRRAVGVVFEESFLFSTTIGENIAFGRPGATAGEIRRAAARAQAVEFIEELPDGYDTVVGERGYTLSGGQRQRVALARAALANPRVLVLDDATSAVDAHTEAAIHDAFEAAMDGRTTILIAHRASTVRLADRVILLDAGRVVADGPVDGLIGATTAAGELLRELLAGPPADPDRAPPATVGAIDAAAWPEGVSRTGAQRMSSRSTAAPMKMNLGGGGAGAIAGATRALARISTETPELLAAVERLPPLEGDHDVDLEAAAEEDRDFSFRTVLRPFTVPLVVGAGLVLVDAATSLAGPLLMRRGIDSGVVQQSSRALWIAAALFLFVQMVSWVNAAAMTFHTSRTAERILLSLRVRVFAHLQRLSLDFYDRHMAGRIMTRMTSDIDALAQLVQQGLLIALVSILSCLGVAVVLIVLAPSLSLAVAVLLPPLFVATEVFRRASGATHHRARTKLAVLYAEMQESLSGALVSQAFAQQPAMEARFRRLADASCDERIRAIELVARFFPFIQLVSTAGKAVALAVGAHQVTGGDLPVGVLIAFVLYLEQFFTPLQQLSNVFDQGLQASAAIAQLNDVLRTPTSTPAAAAPIVPGRLAGEVRLTGARLVYPSTGLVALHDVDLEIPAGQVVALVGTTGAGKSSLVKLVARFYDPTAGAVCVDGLALRELDLAAYRHQLGYVPQEPFLFSGTIATNIAYGRAGAGDLDIERAARAVGAHEFIAALPYGYHTPVSEEGRSLSAGQRQLIGLARAQLVDPAILLLDEATANLDLATEARVQEAMGLVARGRTTLLIAHRLQTARAAQRICVIDEGRIVEDGDHDTLVALGGRYAELWSAFKQAAY